MQMLDIWVHSCLSVQLMAAHLECSNTVYLYTVLFTSEFEYKINCCYLVIHKSKLLMKKWKSESQGVITPFGSIHTEFCACEAITSS